MGAPGVGKGTQAKELVARWAIPQISTGDLLRGNVASGSDLGKQAKQLMDAGKLVSDHLVNEMVEQRLAAPDTRRGYILDGYPRTLAQAEWLDKALTSKAGQLPLVAVSIRGRVYSVTASNHGKTYLSRLRQYLQHLLAAAEKDSVCDLDGAQLQRRGDDSEAVFSTTACKPMKHRRLRLLRITPRSGTLRT